MPVPKLPGDIFLDAVTIDTWMRTHLCDQILANYTAAEGQAFVEATVVDEVTRHLPQTGRQIVIGTLARHGVQTVDLDAADPGLMMMAVRWAREMTDRQIAAGTRKKRTPSANLGEAASITYIMAHHPYAVFVTADQEAIRLAAQARVDVTTPGAFLAAEIATGQLTVEHLWSEVCDTRDCGLDQQDCKRNGKCPNLTETAVKAGVMGWVAEDRRRLVRTIDADLAELQRILDSS